ncbi:MAG: DNA-methyltransferase [Candidatus Dormibacteraceae bacterium]
MRKTVHRNRVIVADVRNALARLPGASVDCVITSPPYYLLRDYGVPGQIGLEASVESWVDELRLAMKGVARVLKPTGTVWLNLGDSYSRHPGYGAPAKSLLLGPERLALGLVDDGWTVRNRIAWGKPNPMPSSVRDRLNTTWEFVYLLTRQSQYHFDLDAVRVPHRSGHRKSAKAKPVTLLTQGTRPTWAGPLAGSNVGLKRLKAAGLVGHPLGANPGDVWTIATAGYRGQHFATFPPALVSRPLLAACPERVCRACGQPWQRAHQVHDRQTQGVLKPTCKCHAGWQPGLVLDPFFGAGTVGVVAEEHGRDWLGIELNPEFARMAEERIAAARKARSEGDARQAA